MKIAVSTLAFGDLPWAEIQRKNAKAYCGRHGYDYLERKTLLREDVPVNWNKLLWLISVLPKYDAVLMKDADSVFVNLSMPLDPLVGEGIVASETKESGGIDAGLVLFRNTTDVLAFLQRVVSHAEAFTIIDGHTDEAGLNRRIKEPGSPPLDLLPSRILNAKYYRNQWGTWTDTSTDTIAVHFQQGVRQRFPDEWVGWMEELASEGAEHVSSEGWV